jgi:hypothetical protein
VASRVETEVLWLNQPNRWRWSGSVALVSFTVGG